MIKLTKEIKDECSSRSKEEVLEDYLESWRKLQVELNKYPNTKSKQHKDILNKIKEVQKKIFAIRASQFKN